jgi:hypothetical protein
LTRAALFALAAVGLASGAHLAGGGTPSPAVALFAVPVLMAGANLLAARRRGPLALFAGLGLTQVGLHLSFMAASAGSTCTATPVTAGRAVPAGAMLMDDGHGHLLMHCSGVAAAHVSGHGSGLWPAPGMVVLHLLAAGLTVLLLARGEAALWALAAQLSFAFVVPGPVVSRPAVRPSPVRPSLRPRPARAVHLRTLSRRGPPRPLPAAG